MNYYLRENIFLYGAGQYAKRLLAYLSIIGKKDHVIKLVVSSIDKNKPELSGIPVVQVDSVADQLIDTPVVVAVAPKSRDDITERLHEIGCKKIVYLTREEYLDIPGLIFKEYREYPIVSNKIFIDCFYGRGYTCNPKAIAEYLTKKNCDVQLIWAVESLKDAILPELIKLCEIGSPDYYKEWYTARVLLTNNGLPGDLIVREDQFFVNTWHGIGPTKRVGVDNHAWSDEGNRYMYQQMSNSTDLMLAGSDFCEYVYRHSLLYSGEVWKSGYPRNDIFFRDDLNTIRNKVYTALGIAGREKVILYAPTYRAGQWDDKKKENTKKAYLTSFKEVKTSLERLIGKELVFLCRYHHVTDRSHIMEAYPENGIDVTTYPDMQELLVTADILISDWSSAIWDFALTRKPVFLYYNDADEVEKETGFYRHPDTYPFPKGHTTEELCNAIEHFDNEAYQKGLDEWFSEYGTYDDGHASERVAARIMEMIEYSENKGEGGNNEAQK